MSGLILWFLLLPVYIILIAIYNEIRKRNKTFNSEEK
jgi:hypothetical protein